MIIIVFGLPGSGKSYFASRLAKRLEAKYVSSDVIRKDLFIHRKYTQEEKMKVYDAMIKEMKKAVQQDENVVLDATFYKESIRDRFNEAAKVFKERIIFIEVRADQRIIIERVSLRREDSDADYSIHLRIKKVFEPLESEHLIVQSTQENIKEMMYKAINYIQTSHG
jgi:predicted kinase